MRLTLLLAILLFGIQLNAQVVFNGEVRMKNIPVSHALVLIKETNEVIFTDSTGKFSITCTLPKFTLRIESPDAESKTVVIECSDIKPENPWILHLITREQIIEEVVVSGSLKQVDKLRTTVPVEIYSNQFLLKNPSPSIMDNLSQINGVRPQINCNICNTGDIHMNGLEGPYTLILIDGMPIVSNLASVYGLAGIPTSLIERIEVVRGPSAVLYGSEAIGGLINVITKNPTESGKLSIDVYSSSYGEINTDLGTVNRYGKNAKGITGINYFHSTNPIDQNEDGFTDITLQKRLSFFHKITIPQKNKRQLSLGARYVYEDRWGGQMNWNRDYRGTDSVYGESIYTNRFEFIGKYELPFKEKISLTGSFASHNQNSYYGTLPFMASQQTIFGQLTWVKDIQKHEVVAGLALRTNFYDDNTLGTFDGPSSSNSPDNTVLPGIFAQDEIQLTENQKLLLGARYDQSIIHGGIFTPRIGYKFDLKKRQLFRINTGTGYRVVNVFTEDHAALTGSRTVVFTEELQPERSFNVNVNYNGTFFLKSGGVIKLDFSPFYSYFSNKIIPDYQSDPTKIIYSNSNGYAESKGVNISMDVRLKNWNINTGLTFMDVSRMEDGMRARQLLTERFSANWTISYIFENIPLEIDYTGNVYGPMLLPLLGPLDPRPAASPWWSIQNIQVKYSGLKRIELYSGVKNLLNWRPGKDLPFLIARAHDPFDKQVVFDSAGNPTSTPTNPYALTFDPSYVYGPNQGIRFFAGIRYQFD